MSIFNKNKYYSLSEIDKLHAKYNVIIGGRSNGKTYSCLQKIIKIYAENGKQGAIIRRWDDDLKGKAGKQMFAGLVSEGEIRKATNGKWTEIYYNSRMWYFAKKSTDSNGKEITTHDNTPFCYGFSLSDMEHDKSISFPDITTVVFDEFLTRTLYMTDEFIIFQNVLSTIIRNRTDVTIYMLGNTVNKYCPYFAEMGLTRIKEMQQGSIDLYTYGDSGLKVAVEYCAPLEKSKRSSDVYFAFDNPRLNMIKTGDWEIDIYPHCPCQFEARDILFTYFIVFDDYICQCEIIRHDNMEFTFIHRKTTKLKNPDEDLIFSNSFDPRPNYRRRVSRPLDKLGERIYYYFKSEKVFYSDNETGEVINNYLKWSKQL